MIEIHNLKELEKKEEIETRDKIIFTFGNKKVDYTVSYVNLEDIAGLKKLSFNCDSILKRLGFKIKNSWEKESRSNDYKKLYELSKQLYEFIEKEKNKRITPVKKISRFSIMDI